MDPSIRQFIDQKRDTLAKRLGSIQQQAGAEVILDDLEQWAETIDFGAATSTAPRLTSEEVMAKFRIPRSTFYHYLRLGILTGIKLPNRRYVFDEDTIVAELKFHDASKREPKPETTAA